MVKTRKKRKSLDTQDDDEIGRPTSIKPNNDDGMENDDGERQQNKAFASSAARTGDDCDHQHQQGDCFGILYVLLDRKIGSLKESVDMIERNESTRKETRSKRKESKVIILQRKKLQLVKKFLETYHRLVEGTSLSSCDGNEIEEILQNEDNQEDDDSKSTDHSREQKQVQIAKQDDGTATAMMEISDRLKGIERAFESFKGIKQMVEYIHTTSKQSNNQRSIYTKEVQATASSLKGVKETNEALQTRINVLSEQNVDQHQTLMEENVAILQSLQDIKTSNETLQVSIKELSERSTRNDNHNENNDDDVKEANEALQARINVLSDQNVDQHQTLMEENVAILQSLQDIKTSNETLQVSIKELSERSTNDSHNENDDDDDNQRDSWIEKRKKIIQNKAKHDHLGSFIGTNFVWKNDNATVGVHKSSIISTALTNRSHQFYQCCHLDCQIMKIGWIYQWTIQVTEGSGNYISLGISSSIHDLAMEFSLGIQTGGWGYYSYGNVYHKGKLVTGDLLKFGSDRVTLTLDLSNVQMDETMGGRGGTLSARIERRWNDADNDNHESDNGRDKSNYYHYDDNNEKKEFILFDNLIKDGIKVGMDFLNGDGFYPAVSVCKDATIEFIGFQSVMEGKRKERNIGRGQQNY